MSSITNAGNSMNPWIRRIPIINTTFMATSLVLVFGLDLLIAVSSPELRPFWYAMLIVFGVFSFFLYLENFVLRKKFTNNIPTIDNWITFVIVVRNIIFFLNFIPLIQILGMLIVVYVGWAVLLLYIGFMIARVKAMKKII